MIVKCVVRRDAKPRRVHVSFFLGREAGALQLTGALLLELEEWELLSEALQRGRNLGHRRLVLEIEAVDGK